MKLCRKSNCFFVDPFLFKREKDISPLRVIQVDGIEDLNGQFEVLLQHFRTHFALVQQPEEAF